MAKFEGADLLAYLLKRIVPRGASTQYESYLLLEECGNAVSCLAELHGIAVRVSLETERTDGLRYTPPTVKGLIIFTPKKRAVIVPMTLSPGLCRVRAAPIFLSHEGGAEQLFNAILGEVEAAISEEAEAAA